MISLSEELDRWIKRQGKQKPFTTRSQYVRAVLQADYDLYQGRVSKSSSASKKSK